MAKKKIKEDVLKEDDKELTSVFKKLLNSVDGSQVGSDVKTTEWVDTGIMSLNFLLSGDVNRGIPSGKIVVVAGESQSGKSFLAGRIASNSQRGKVATVTEKIEDAKKKGYVVIWLDTESASDSRFLIRIGLDADRVIYRRVGDISIFQKTVLSLLNTAENNKVKLFIVLDSLGNLSGTKEVIDADSDKMTSDMGQRAKNVRAVFRLISSRLQDSGSILFCVNHVYISPGFIPETKMGGGMAPSYLGQIILFLTKLKAEPGISTKVKVLAKKNREYIEGRKCEFIINFKEGLNPKDGMVDLFEEFKVIKKKGGWYILKLEDGTERSLREVDIYKDDVLFDTLLEEFKKKTHDISYHNFI